MERDFLSVNSIEFSLHIVEIKFFSKFDEKCSVSKIVRTFLLIYIEKNFEKIMVEEIFN